MIPIPIRPLLLMNTPRTGKYRTAVDILQVLQIF
jgi:hypothetical protein